MKPLMHVTTLSLLRLDCPGLHGNRIIATEIWNSGETVTIQKPQSQSLPLTKLYYFAAHIIEIVSTYTKMSIKYQPYILRFETSLFVASYNSQGYGGGIRPLLHTRLVQAKSKSHCDWPSVSLSVLVSIPGWGSWPDVSSCLKVTVLSMWGALSDERSGLSFTIPAGPRQRSHFLVRVP
jgi:hypothetical protein